MTPIGPTFAEAVESLLGQPVPLVEEAVNVVGASRLMVGSIRTVVPKKEWVADRERFLSRALVRETGRPFEVRLRWDLPFAMRFRIEIDLPPDREL